MGTVPVSQYPALIAAGGTDQMDLGIFSAEGEIIKNNYTTAKFCTENKVLSVA